MVKKAMYQKILQPKLQGYSQAGVAEKLNIDRKAGWKKGHRKRRALDSLRLPGCEPDSASAPERD